MVANNQENPLYERFDEVIDICREKDVALSLGDALRPGALADVGDRAQMEELYTLGELARRAPATRIAAHAADIANGLPGARDWDDAMSRARKARAWEKMLELALDPAAARSSRQKGMPKDSDVCSMCGEFCALRGEDYL